MNLGSKRKIGYSIFLLIAIILIACLFAGIIWAGISANLNVTNLAYAALPDSYTNLLPGGGLEIYNPTYNSGSYICENLLTSGTSDAVGTTSTSDYIFTGISGITTSVEDGDETITYSETIDGTEYTYSGFSYLTEEISSGCQIEISIPILSTSDLYTAINDDMLDVQISAYSYQMYIGTADGQDTATSTLTYNNGVTSTSVEKEGVKFPSYPEEENEYAMSDNLSLPDSCKDGAYVQLVIDDFVQYGNNFAMVITKFAFRITITLKDDVVFSSQTSDDTEIVDVLGTRYEDATSNMVKTGDIIYISSMLQQNEDTLTINDGTSEDTAVTGKYYRNLYLDAEVGTSRSEYPLTQISGSEYWVSNNSNFNNDDFVNWTFSSALTRIYYFTDEDGVVHDLTSDYTALDAAFIVNDSTATTIDIVCNMENYADVEMLEGNTYSYILDTEIPNSPSLDSSTTFYEKYITDETYYTKEVGYNTEYDSLNNEVVKSVTIGSNTEGSDAYFSDQITSLQGLSGELVYYRATKLEDEPDIVKASSFTPDEATGIYCAIVPTVAYVNSEYTITDKNIYYQGMELTLREGDDESNYTYPEQGIFKIEFFTYDYVGNKCSAASAVIIRVDVADYTFEVITKVGSTQVTTIADETFSLTYYALDDDNELEERSNTTFKHDDKIIIKLDFTADGYSNYILTYFQTAVGDAQNTSNYSYDSSDAIYLTNEAQSKTVPTFTLNSNYAGDDKEDNRQLIFTFKTRATITVSNLTHTYEPGIPMAVTTSASISSGTITNVTIITTYSETLDGTYTAITSDFPVDAGTYYYKCELTSTKYYGYTTGTMKITKETPTITNLRISSINYGDSLSIRDTLYDEDSQQYVMSDSIFCSYSYVENSITKTINTYNMSSDGVYGYFSIVEPSVTSENYTKPTAGTLNTKILFTAILCDDDGNPLYDDDGNFVVNSNYYTVTVSDVVLTINHSTDVTCVISDVDDSGNIEKEYSGESLNIEVSITAIDDGRTIDLSDYLLYSFTDVDRDDGLYSSDIPTEAGTYNVKYRLNTSNSNCNYTGSWEQTFIITQRELKVWASDMTMEYQRETEASPTAEYFYVGGSTVYYSLNYKFTYYYYDENLSEEEMAVDDNQVPDDSDNMFNSLPCNAGVYLVKVEIDEDNYANEDDTYIMYTINKVSTLSGDYISYEYPTLSWTSSTSGYHLYYLQPLKAIDIAETQTTIIQYYCHYMELGKVKYHWVTIEGSFIIAHTQYTGDYSIEDIESFVDEENEYDQLTAGNHSLYLYFVPEDDNVENFDLIGVSYNVSVGKAVPVFTDITVDSITYGDLITSIDDMVISKSVKCKLYAEDSTSYYTTLDESSYSYEIYSISNSLLPAGNNNIIVTFIPTDTDNYEESNGTVSITVNKKTLSIAFDENDNYDSDSGKYIYKYKGYSNTSYVYTSSELVKSTDNPSGYYTYYKYDETSIFGDLYTATYFTVGDYAIVYTINNSNYDGNNYYLVEIEKDSLTKNSDPTISQEATSVSYGKAMNMVVFSGGSMLSQTTNSLVSGTFSFNYPASTVFTTVGEQILNMIFTPTDTENYNVYDSDGVNTYKIKVTVTRADISDSLTLSVSDDYYYGDLAYDWDYSDTSYTTSIYTNGTLFSTTKIDDTYDYLSADMSISNRPMTGYFSAGTYSLTLTIDETVQSYYEGEMTVSMTIAKKKALIVIDDNEKEYNSKSQTIDVSVYEAIEDGENVTQGDKLSETVKQTFYKNGVKLSVSPSSIGVYTAYLVLSSTNYEYYYSETLTSTFTIKVDDSQIVITNLSQTYSIQRTLGISLGSNDAVYTVEYYSESLSSLYDTLPSDAGTYQVWLVFDSASNNGYSETVIYKSNLVIEKYTATIVASDIVSVVYTNSSNKITVSTEPYNLSIITTYRGQDETEFSSTEVLYANTDDGYHEVKFTINNANYQGEKVIKYYITPATLTVESNPTFNSYTYNSDIMPILNTEGSVRFDYDTYITNGEYSIDLDTIKYLDVGSYNVTYSFTAWDDESNVDNNYQVATGTTVLVITKQVIDESNIIIPDDISLSVNYNASYQYVYASLCANTGDCDCADYYDADYIDRDGLIYDIDSSNKDFVINIYYNGNSTPAKAIGEYTIYAQISSKNYSGSKTFSSKLIVSSGIPEVSVLPTVKSDTMLNITGTEGSYVYPTVTTNDINAGICYITNTKTKISGIYTVVDGQELNRANINELDILFTPTDGNFSAITITIDVNVIGTDPLSGITNDITSDWSNLDITSNISGTSYATVNIVAIPHTANPQYGVTTADFDLYFVNTSDGTTINTDYSDFGIISFVNSDYMPSVGELVAIKFTPYDIENQEYDYIYNVMYGLIDLEIEKTEVPEWDYYLKGFEGKSFNDDMVFEIYQDSTIIDLEGGSLNIYSEYTDESNNTLFDFDTIIYYDDVKDTQVYIIYSSTNYVDICMQMDILVYGRIDDDDIIVLYTSKEYSDGTGIVLEDLGLQINGGVNIESGSITLYITDSDGEEDIGSSIGTYDILIVIDNGSYYGSKLVSGFIVERKDVSELLSLSNYASTYGSFIMPSVIYNGATFSSSYYTKRYKLSSASDSSYSSIIDEDADDYNIKIIVDSENYTGTAIFEYSIDPIIVRVYSTNKVVIYSSIDAESAPEVSFKLENSEDDLVLTYELYYYSDNYTISSTKPSDVGVFTVRMIIDDTNYAPSLEQNYSEFYYTITQAAVGITTEPTVLSSYNADDNTTYNIKYGQTLSNISLSGGVAKRNNVEVTGTFSVDNGTYKPDAGSYVITIIFTPNNSNYATATCDYTITVEKGDAQVVVDNLYAAYDGESKINWITKTVQPSGVSVSIIYTNTKGVVVTNPTDAGTYYITAQSLNSNYSVSISKSIDGSTTPRLVITKASVQETDGVYNVNDPIALSISCGDSLSKSSLSQGDGYGEVYYNGFSNPVAGSFTYVQKSLIFSTAGVFTTSYLFTPSDISNYDTYTGTVSITVNMAYATITVSNTSFIYGEGFTLPTFTTSPSNLSYEHNITFNEYDISGDYDTDDVIPAGTYYFKVWITSTNYAREENYLDFSIYVAKKEIDLSFVDSDGTVVTQYSTTYGVTLATGIMLYEETNDLGKAGYLLKDAIVNDIKITDRTVTSFDSTDSSIEYSEHTAPTDIGSYEVTVSIVNDNYTASNTVSYIITRGVIDEVIFDTETLENQIYGSVVAPIINTIPTNISYYIVYQGYGTVMPTSAGTYSIIVYFDDDNYEKKQISAMFKINPKSATVINITVEDKVYDGVSSVEISGSLSGIALGDEVELTLTAATVDNDASIGYHYVEITSYKISGLQASNYTLSEPVYYTQMKIYTKVIEAAASSSYVTSSTGFNDGTTVTINELNVSENETNIFTKAMGVESTVVGYTLLENGQETIMTDMIKVYIAIPEDYIGTDFTVEGAGALAGQTIIFTQEGNYITFYTTTSGSVVFSKTDFQYGFAVTVISIIVILIGIVVLFILNPLQRSSSTRDNSKEKAIKKKIKRGY
jgi:hypothetical protein